MASLSSLLNAAKAASAAAKASKGVQIAANIAKGLWTAIEIADAGMDVYMLGNEIAKALGVTDAEILELIDKVTEKGIEYDTIMDEVSQANIDIDNLLAGITTLQGNSAEFSSLQGVAFEKIEALDTLKGQLSSSIPTSYSWFDSLVQLDDTLTEDNQEKIDAIQEMLGPNYLIMGIAGGSLGLRAVMLGYSRYKNSTAEIPELYRQKATVFDGGDLDMFSEGIETRKTKFQTVRSGFTKYGTLVFQGVEKLLSVGSFGLNIYTLIEAQKVEDEIKESLNDMLERYESGISTYGFMLNGCKNEDGNVNEEGLQAVADEFGIVLEEQTLQAKETLEIGYAGVIEGYEETINNLLGEVGEVGEVGEDGMDYAYKSTIDHLEEVNIYEADSDLISQLRINYNNFKMYKVDALDKDKDSDVRKGALDDIAEEFSNSLVALMDKINEELTVGIASHTSLQLIIVDANATIADAEFFGSEWPYPERWLEGKASSAYTRLNTVYPNRDKLTTEEEILAGLKTLIPELLAQSAEVASV